MLFILQSQKDSLMEMSFHVPSSNTQFVGDEDRPPAQVSLFVTLNNILLQQIIGN